MSDLLRYLFTKSNTIVDDTPTKSNKLYDKSMYIKIVNKSYKDILLTPDELFFLKTLPSKKLEIILNINRNNRACDKSS